MFYIHLLYYIIYHARKALHDLLSFITIHPLWQVTIMKERREDSQNNSTSHHLFCLELQLQQPGLFQGFELRTAVPLFCTLKAASTAHASNVSYLRLFLHLGKERKLKFDLLRIIVRKIFYFRELSFSVTNVCSFDRSLELKVGHFEMLL